MLAWQFNAKKLAFEKLSSMTMNTSKIGSSADEKSVNVRRFKWAQKVIKMPGSHFLTWLGTYIGVPYTSTIRPRFVHIAPGHFEVAMKKRRAVTNHMGTIHAAAMANLIELTASGAVLASIPRSARWIPSGMNIEYLKKAKTDLRSVCDFCVPDWHTKQDLIIEVQLFDRDEQQVARGEVFIRVGPKDGR